MTSWRNGHGNRRRASFGLRAGQRILMLLALSAGCRFVAPVSSWSFPMKRLSCFLAVMSCGTAFAQTTPAPKAENKTTAAQAAPAAPATKGETRREARQADRAAAQQQKKQVPLPTPTAEVAYGDQQRQK